MRNTDFEENVELEPLIIETNRKNSVNIQDKNAVDFHEVNIHDQNQHSSSDFDQNSTLTPPTQKPFSFNIWLVITLFTLYYIYLFNDFDPETTQAEQNVKILTLQKSLEHNYQEKLDPVIIQLKKTNTGSVIKRGCNMMLQHGHWESLDWTLMNSAELVTTTEDIILRGFKLIPYTFRGVFQADTCEILDYTVGMMKQCFGGDQVIEPKNTKHLSKKLVLELSENAKAPETYWHLMGDSRTRVMFRGLNARLEKTTINDHRVHGTLQQNNFVFHWSRFFTEMSEVVEKTKFTKNSSLVIGEQYLHKVLTTMLEIKTLDAAFVEDLLQTQIYHFNETVIKRVLDNENIDVVVVLATEGLEANAIHSEYKNNFVLANKHWTAEMWVESAGFYNKLLYDCVKHWQQVESGKYADKLFWMTNNRKTGRYEQTVSDSNPNSSKTNMTILLPDGVHKIAHDKVKQVPDSLKADTNMLYNLFCNKKLKREKFEGHGVQLDEFKSSTCCV